MVSVVSCAILSYISVVVSLCLFCCIGKYLGGCFDGLYLFVSS